MPYKIHIEPHGVLVEWHGRTNTGEMLRYQADIQAHPQFDAIRYEIHDLTACDAVFVDGADVELMAALDYAGTASAHDIALRIAVVSEDPIVADGVKAYVDSKLSPCPIRLFPSVALAKLWVESPW